MSNIVSIKLITFCLVGSVKSLLCFNCSSSHHSWDHCGGDFVKPDLIFNSSKYYLVNCTEENSMCFVRSWRARDRHAWIVQRGCYRVNSDDIFPRTLGTPTRAMTCKSQRSTDAEYKTCLCNADWCNSANYLKISNILYYLFHVLAFQVIL